MTITVEIKGLEPIVEAVNRLAQSLGARGLEVAIHDQSGQAAPITGQAFPMQSHTQGYTMAQAAPQQQAVPMTSTVPTGQVPTNNFQTQMQPGGAAAPNQMTPLQGQIPTTAVPQGYTQDQLAVAMTGLVDRGMQPVVMQILSQFGAMSLQQLPKEQYPAVAAELRKAGANI